MYCVTDLELDFDWEHIVDKFIRARLEVSNGSAWKVDDSYAVHGILILVSVHIFVDLITVNGHNPFFIIICLFG